METTFEMGIESNLPGTPPSPRCQFPGTHPHVLYYLESTSNRPLLSSSNLTPTFLEAAVWPSLHSLGCSQPGHIVSFKNTLLSTKHVHFNTPQLGKSPPVSSPTHHTMHVRGKFLPQLMGQPNVSSSQSPCDGTHIIWHRSLTGPSPILVQLPSREYTPMRPVYANPQWSLSHPLFAPGWLLFSSPCSFFTCFWSSDRPWPLPLSQPLNFRRGENSTIWDWMPSGLASFLALKCKNIQLRLEVDLPSSSRIAISQIITTSPPFLDLRVRSETTLHSRRPRLLNTEIISMSHAATHRRTPASTVLQRSAMTSSFQFSMKYFTMQSLAGTEEICHICKLEISKMKTCKPITHLRMKHPKYFHCNAW